MKCHNCGVEIVEKKEVVTTFKEQDKWEKYINTHMKNAPRHIINNKISIQSGDRVLAEWSGNYGFVSEGRKLLERLANWKGY